MLEVDAGEDTRIAILFGRVREATETAGNARQRKAGRLVADPVAEKVDQDLSRGCAHQGVRGRIVGYRRSHEERLPSDIRLRAFVTVARGILDRSNRTPESEFVLRVESSDV